MKKKELLQLIVDLQDRVRDLERRLNPERIPFYQFPSVWDVEVCTNGNKHAYPAIWHGTTPPACIICGYQQQFTPPFFTITSTTDTAQVDTTEDDCCGKQNPCCSKED